MFRTPSGTGEYVRAVWANIGGNYPSGAASTPVFYDARGDVRIPRAGEVFYPMDATFGEQSTVDVIQFYFEYAVFRAADYETFLHIGNRDTTAGNNVYAAFRLPQRRGGDPATLRLESDNIQEAAILHGYLRSA